MIQGQYNTIFKDKTTTLNYALNLHENVKKTSIPKSFVFET